MSNGGERLFNFPTVVIGDTTALVAIGSSLVGWISPLAAIVALVWYAIQIWESRTIRSFVQARAQRRIMRLKAKLASLQIRTVAQAAAIEVKAAGQVAAADVREAARDAAKSLAESPKTPGADK